MTDLLTRPGFMDYVLAYEAQGMTKETAIDKAHERIFGASTMQPEQCWSGCEDPTCPYMHPRKG